MAILMPRASMISVVRRLGLSGGLKLCLDAGDNASYDAAVQTDKWLDTSGGGYDFFRGSGTGTDAADPTFNGTAGRRTSGEYWSFDGGDYFTYDTTNEGWMQNLHKDNAKFTVLSWNYVTTLGVNHGVFGNSRGSGTRIGAAVNFRINDIARLNISNSSGVAALTFDSVATIPQNKWFMSAVSIDEANSSGFWFVNATIDTGSASYTSPSAGNATEIFQIGARGAGDLVVPSGFRFSSFLIWEGRALSQAEVRAFHLATRGKFGV